VRKCYIHRDGTIIWCRVLLTLVRDPAGNPHRVLIVVLDITEQVRARLALQAHTLGLTRVELAILALLATPHLRTYAQIGARLFRSGETIRKHAQHIAGKLGLPSASRANIVAAAQEHGLLDLPVSDHPLDGV
jgi:DNA-binding CsgD family transcriptional regulator